MNFFTGKSIIVPWDFSDMSKAALDKAADMAGSLDQLEVIHVTPYPATADYSIVWGAYCEDNILEKIQESFYKEMADTKYKDVKFTALFGDPGSRISEYIDSSDAGLVVISSHGRTGLKRMMLGSVAERVVRLSTCPVLVLRDKPTQA